MSDLKTVVERYLEIWNEPDADTRAKKISEVCAEDVTYTDPMASVSGGEGVNGLIGAVREQFPGLVFTLAAPADAHHDIVRFTWNLAPAGATEPVVVGFDVVKTGPDGRIAAVYGFLDKVPSA